MAILGVERDPTSGQLVLPTEIATTAWGLLGGIGGGLAQIVVSKRLSEIDKDSIGLSSLAVPIAASFAGTVLGAFLVPKA